MSYCGITVGRPAGAWSREELLRGHGSRAAYRRHLYRGELACDSCLEDERLRKAAQRAAQRAAGKPVQR